MKFLICTRPIGIGSNRKTLTDFFSIVSKSLKEQGHEVVLLITHRKPNEQEEDWYRKNNLRWVLWQESKKLNSKLSYLFNLIKILKVEKPDYVEFHFTAMPFGMLASYFLGIPNRCCWCHSLPSNINDKNKIARILNRLRLKLYYSLSTQIVANSEATKKELLKYYPSQAQKVFVNYLGTYPPDENTISKIDEPFSIACLGRIVHQKGQHILIKSLPFLIEQFPQIKVYFAGSGDFDQIQTIAKQNDVEEYIKYLGILNINEVFDLYRNTTITVFPTMSEAFGLVAIEAMSTGAVLIGSATGGLLDIIEHNKSGLLFTPGDSKELADNIKTVFLNDEERQRLSSGAKERSEFFNIYLRADEYAKFISTKVC